MRIMWVETSFCHWHGEASCDCEAFMHGRRWQLFCEAVNHGATISQFNDDGPFYGTWEVGGGGRSGAVSNLDACKRRIEAEVQRHARPN